MRNNKSSYLIFVVVILLTGTLKAQTCRTSITETTPTSRFTINGNATVTDNKTGLTWMRCSLGQNWDGSTCTGTESRHTWQAALSIAESTSFAGANDWRLPNIKELVSIIEYACFDPSINETIFPETPSINTYWSSSPVLDASDLNYVAWIVWFKIGSTFETSYETDPITVRLVRTEQ